MFSTQRLHLSPPTCKKTTGVIPVMKIYHHIIHVKRNGVLSFERHEDLDCVDPRHWERYTECGDPTVEAVCVNVYVEEREG